VLSIGTRTYILKRVAKVMGEVTQIRKSELWQRRSIVVEDFQKQKDLGWRITYIIRSRASSANITVVIPLVLILSLSLYLSLSLSLSLYLYLYLSIFPSIVNPTRTCGWIPACPRSQGPPRRNYERDENRERRDRMCFTFVIFSFPTNTSTRNNINNKRNGL